MNAPGRRMLKIVGILYIVFEGFGIAMTLFGMDNASLGEALETGSGFPLPVLLLWYSFTLFMGIMGVTYCNVLEKAKLLMGLAVIDLIVTLFSALVASQWSTLIGFALPILYFIGALKNKNAVTQTN